MNNAQSWMETQLIAIGRRDRFYQKMLEARETVLLANELFAI